MLFSESELPLVRIFDDPRMRRCTGLIYLGQTADLSTVETKDQFLRNYILGLSSPLSSLRLQGLLCQDPPLGFPVHLLQPGDHILIKTWKEDKLEPPWEGPFQMLLTTETAVRTAEKDWTHYVQVKGTKSPNQEEQWAVVQHPNPTQLTLKRL